MYERSEDMKLAVGSVSAYPNNLSVCCLESKNITYACVVHKTQVHIVNWDNKNESVIWDSISILDTTTDKPVDALQAALVLPNIRTYPLLVVGTTSGAQIFDIRTLKLLHQESVSSGRIIQFLCSGETSISTKKCLKEHAASIADIATCRHEEITCSGDCSGIIIVWNKSFKGVQLKIATQHPITAVNVLHKHVIVGTLRGRVLFFSISGGELMAEVFAHARSVTCISVASENACVLTGSEDGRFTVFKLQTTNAQAFQVEYQYCDELSNCAIMGGQFTNSHGSNIVVACFDRNILYRYHIVEKTNT
ncbi:hypothetical protein KIN20_009928 [Parelaphostrongylus tenuis]|uniref:WD repeat-containing protein 54 beta-propeller domain-containing protein n=1 Tax=Parelaphostrongylus tenuis TaxID=148309 RepID=A0AAD5QII2_PARTN|nr:hypothetical protein KIN20_009928 [Parelaphostrongylus tenuis]